MRFLSNSRDQKLPSLAKIVKESKEYYIFHEEGKENVVWFSKDDGSKPVANLNVDKNIKWEKKNFSKLMLVRERLELSTSALLGDQIHHLSAPRSADWANGPRYWRTMLIFALIMKFTIHHLISPQTLWTGRNRYGERQERR